METIKLKWTGIRPILMSNPQTIRISNPFSVKSRRLNRALKAARKKEDENILVELESEQLRNDWESSAYWDEKQHEFFVPDTSLVAVIKAGAQASKKGKDVDRALIVNETEAYISSKKKFKSLEEAFADPEYRYEGPCRVPPRTGVLIWKARCMIPTGWSLQFSIDFDKGIIARQSVIDANINAGRLCGLGGWRPKFGRFLVDVIS